MDSWIYTAMEVSLESVLSRNQGTIVSREGIINKMAVTINNMVKDLTKMAEILTKTVDALTNMEAIPTNIERYVHQMEHTPYPSPHPDSLQIFLLSFNTWNQKTTLWQAKGLF